jgi:hypothetical protein
MFIPDTICWCFDLSSRSLTMKEMIEANLNPKAIEKINAPENPEIALLI